tara:strand:+ start:258 stop:476 length:219 start_codon:yes stop_codon:yes gene_type:complete
MPFKSDKQRRFLFSQKPDVAAKFVRDSKSTGGKMEKHKKHHSAKHMKVMKTAIKKGSSFKSAHKKAMKKVGA